MIETPAAPATPVLLTMWFPSRRMIAGPGPALATTPHCLLLAIRQLKRLISDCVASTVKTTTPLSELFEKLQLVAEMRAAVSARMPCWLWRKLEFSSFAL